MASKTYDGGHDSDGNGSGGAPPATVPNARAGNAGDSGGGEQDSDDLDEDDDGHVADLNGHDNGTSGAAASGKKKKRKRTKKKKSASAGAIPKEQSNPPRVRVADLFPSGDYPVGEMSAYDENLSRTTGEETRYLSRMDDDFLREYREAAEVHRQVRQWAQKHLIKPGKTLIEIAEGIEDSVRALVGHPGLEPGDSLKGGMGFPVGLSLNSCAAHYNPNAGNKIVLQKEDVLKVDIGVHVNGRIVDSAWTMAWDPQYDNLLKSVQEATETGVREAGIDARMSHIGAAIQETMESYEVEINGKTYPIKAIRSITGHDIKQFIVHGGKMVPFIKNRDETKMEEGEVFAIETFGSTGRGYLRDDLEVSHYSKNPDAPRVPLRVASAKSVLKTVEENFGTIPFCRRQLDRLGLEKYLYGLNNLVSSGIINSYPPLVDIKGSYTAQYEHTILLRPEGKEIISRGDDY